MQIFKRSTDDSPEGQELGAARAGLAADPFNRGDLGTVDINSPAAQDNLDAQDRLNRAERAYRSR